MGLFSSCACDGENLMKAMFWGMNKLAGDGYFPSAEILALGEFEQVEINMSKSHLDGQTTSQVELRLINGKGHSMHQSEENLARKCAELYAEGYSKIMEYDEVKIVFIQTDPFNPNNMAMSEYIFRVEDLINSVNNYDYGFQ
ncbi:hypothetical protein CLV48_103347 [Cecembia rubra]|uniref:Uncharacterized protein n=2 Tax=Cecembia rubra TaxID=1485585 RepID=A0A2P8E8M4_9BACT|nr:hypothetical protein CLV48_103347 [Cecembia rubra]